MGSKESIRFRGFSGRFTRHIFGSNRFRETQGVMCKQPCLLLPLAEGEQGMGNRGSGQWGIDGAGDLRHEELG
jgi:hypothetical protein